jgi:hypothetical protein
MAAAAFALAGVLFVVVAVRAVGDGTNPDPDSAALGSAFTRPGWALAAALVGLPLLALVGSLVFTPKRRRNR